MSNIRKTIHEQQQDEMAEDFLDSQYRGRAHGADIASDQRRAVRGNRLRRAIAPAVGLAIVGALLVEASNQGVQTAGSPVHDPNNIPQLPHDPTPPVPSASK